MTDWRPTPKQRAVLEAASELGLRRSVVLVCEEAGVSRESFYRWMREDAGFRDAWEESYHGTIRKHLPGVIAAMVERGQSGDVAAARLLADMAGVIKQKHEVTGAGGGPVKIHMIVVEKPDGV